MYTPTKKKSRGDSPPPVQTAGAYISTMADPSTLMISDISAETLSTLAWMANMSSIANISSFDEITNLSISQISSLIAAVNQQISNENTHIINNQAQITAIQAQIDAVPGGYQDEYNKANEQYISVQRAYALAQSTLAYDQSTLSSKIAELISLSTLSSLYTSSVEGYQAEYSSIWRSIQANNQVIADEESTFQGKMRAYLEYQYNYSTAIANMESTLHALKYNSSILSTATSDYFSTSTAYGYLLEDYINFSTNNLSISQYLFTSTNKYLSSLMYLQSTQYANYVSTSTALHLANMNVNAAQATYDYRNALSAELNSITSYNAIEAQIRQLLQRIGRTQSQIQGQTGARQQRGDGNEISYYMNQPPPPGEELAYQTLLMMLSTLSTTMFSTSKVREELQITQSTIELITLKAILDAADDNISAAQYTYYLAEKHQRDVISTMSGLSTRIGVADIMEHDYLSTLIGLSTIYLQDLSTYNGVNAEISTYRYTESILNGFLRSTLLTLFLLSTQSSLYNVSIGIYMQSYIGYSTLEAIAQSSINGYSSVKGYMLSTMYGLDDEIGTLGVTVGGQFADLTSNSARFYQNVIIDLNNDIDAYKYGIQEWDSFIGYLTSELLIQKLNLYTAIDSITFSLQGNITSDRQSVLVAQRNSYGTLQTNIQGIINALNDLDTQFARLLQVVETERQNKINFVNTRAILTGYEIEVLKDPTQYTIVQAQYIFQLANLNTRVQSINTNILSRNQQMTALYNIMNPQLSILNGLNIISYTLPDPLDTNTGPFNIDKTEYQLLPQLNYGLNQAMYPLVLTSLVPDTITGNNILPTNLFYQ